MRLPDAIAPYASLLKWLLIAGLLIAIAWFARSNGMETQAKRDAAKIEAKNAALRKAGDALSAAARTLREIDTATRLAKQQADDWKEAARAADQQGASGRRLLEQRIKELAAEAERERFTCSAAEARICGSLLR